MISLVYNENKQEEQHIHRHHDRARTQRLLGAYSAYYLGCLEKQGRDFPLHRRLELGRRTTYTHQIGKAYWMLEKGSEANRCNIQ